MTKLEIGTVAGLIAAIIGGAVWVGELSGKVDEISKNVEEIGKNKVPEVRQAISVAREKALQEIRKESSQISGILKANRSPGEPIEPGGTMSFGSWGEWASCPDREYVCAIQQKVEGYQGGERDDTAVNGVRIRCCPLLPNGR